MKIGEIKNGMPVTISPSSPNEHILLVGTSGSGKSTRIAEMLADCVKRHETVIVIDVNGSDFCNDDGQKNVISAVEDGLNLSLLNMVSMLNKKESYIDFISYIVECFSAIANLGVRQMGVLREAIAYGIEHYNEYESDMAAIADGLCLQDSPIAAGVYNKIWNLLQCPVFKHNAKQMEKGTLNVISLRGINSSTQKQIVELLLLTIWRRCRLQGEDGSGLHIVLDEFQNLSLKKNSVLTEMLREARKCNVKLILSTQSIVAFPKEVMAAISQTAVQLYFRQSVSDVKKIAEFIDPQQKERWTLILKKLALGESVAAGDFLVDGKEIHQPIIIKSAFKKSSQNHYEIKDRQC